MLGRLLQDFSGETMAHEARVGAHVARMEHSPIRRVRQRREGGHPSTSHEPKGSTSTHQVRAEEEEVGKAEPHIKRSHRYVGGKLRECACRNLPASAPRGHRDGFLVHIGWGRCCRGNGTNHDRLTSQPTANHSGRLYDCRAVAGESVVQCEEGETPEQATGPQGALETLVETNVKGTQLVSCKGGSVIVALRSGSTSLSLWRTLQPPSKRTNAGRGRSRARGSAARTTRSVPRDGKRMVIFGPGGTFGSDGALPPHLGADHG